MNFSKINPITDLNCSGIKKLLHPERAFFDFSDSIRV